MKNKWMDYKGEKRGEGERRVTYDKRRRGREKERKRRIGDDR